MSRHKIRNTASTGALTDPETGQHPIEAFLYLFFRPSETSQAAARAYWARRHMRKKDVDPPTSAQTMAAQRAAITEWRQPRGERFVELKAIKQPTLVVNGHNDIMVPTINSFTLSQNIPNAQLIIYPDAGHGALFQVPELFVAHAEMSLNGSGVIDLLRLFDGDGTARTPGSRRRISPRWSPSTS